MSTAGAEDSSRQSWLPPSTQLDTYMWCVMSVLQAVLGQPVPGPTWASLLATASLSQDQGELGCWRGRMALRKMLLGEAAANPVWAGGPVAGSPRRPRPASEVGVAVTNPPTRGR